MVQDRLKIMKGGGMDVMLSRQTFLYDPNHLFHVLYLPSHDSRRLKARYDDNSVT